VSEEFADRVYQPAEDSGLLADAAREAVEPDHRVLDVGTGSGYVAARVGQTGARVIGSDLNPHACRQARANGIEAVRTDLTDGFFENSFDVVVFNPPYLPTTAVQDQDDWLEHALSGGETGRNVIDPFIDSLARVLRPEGFALVLLSSLTGIEEVTTRACEAGFEIEEVVSESHFFECLVVLELSHTDR
jgi:release factor glutamine methyltransferase